MALFLQSFMMINQQRKINAQNESLLKGTLTFFSHCSYFMYVWIFRHQTNSKIQYYLNYKIHRISVVIFYNQSHSQICLMLMICLMMKH